MSFRKILSNEHLSLLAWTCLLFVLITGLIGAALLFNAKGQAYLLATFTEEHVRILGMFDNRGQQMAYRVFLVFLGIFTLVMWFRRPRPVLLVAPEWLYGLLRYAGRYSGIFLLIIVVAGTFIQYKIQPGASLYSLQGRYGIGYLPSGRIQLALMILGALVVYLTMASCKIESVARRLRIICVMAVIFIAAYAASAFLYGILKQPDFHDFTPGLLIGIEWHYAGSVASADRLALGDRIGEIAIHAGLLPSALLGYWQLKFGALDFGGHIRFIAYLQTCFFLIAVAAYAKWYAGRWLPVVIAMLLVLPWVVPIHAAVLYPNQSAWRFLGLGFGALALVYLHMRPVRDISGLLGLASGLALLWNLETGFAVVMAHAGFLVVRATSESGSIRLGWAGARFALGFLFAVLVFFCCIRFAFGYWADPIGVIQSFPLLSGFAKGYGGLQLKQIDPLAALIFIHALYVFVRGIVRWGSGNPVGPRKACEMALAGLILLWGAYYFKGPHFWNLWSYRFLYGFFVGSLILPQWHVQLRRLAYFARSARLIALALIIVPSVIGANLLTVRSLGLVARQPACAQGGNVSGLCLPAALAQEVSQKAVILKKLNEQEPLLFLSANSYLMPLLTGINQPLQMRDAFSETILKSDFDRLVLNVLTVRPRRVLFDDPQSPASGYPAHREFYGRVRSAIATDYVQKSTASGWEIWERRKN